MASEDVSENTSPSLSAATMPGSKPRLTPGSTPSSTQTDSLHSSEFSVVPPSRLHFIARLRWLLLLLVLPGLIAITFLLMRFLLSREISLSILAVLLLLWYFAFSTALDRIVRPLQVLSNVVAALREDDYSFRARSVPPGDALGELATEIHLLADSLQQRRHAELEASALLARVVETMDMPVFAFDADSTLRLTNPAAAHLLGHSVEMLLHQSAEQLGLSSLLLKPEEDVVVLRFGGQETRWMVRRSLFYQKGIPHRLLLLSDVSDVLREEERRAWLRLIRVLTHEVNNSLTPIKSIAGSLRARIVQSIFADAETSADFERGLAVVEERAESLNRFLHAYGQLARLPQPVRRSTALTPLLERVCHLETRIAVEITHSPDVTIAIDIAQIEQVLINLIRNAVDAVIESAQQSKSADAAWVGVSWEQESECICIRIEDNGPGLANPTNLFVPFYTTKTTGSGIGLVLSRQIAELHGGSLSLCNRKNAAGCIAELRLPINNNR